jgi:hypothetical protein
MQSVPSMISDHGQRPAGDITAVALYQPSAVSRSSSKPGVHDVANDALQELPARAVAER